MDTTKNYNLRKRKKILIEVKEKWNRRRRNERVKRLKRVKFESKRTLVFSDEVFWKVAGKMKIERWR